MREFKGEYLGFTFNDIHSSALGIVRTTNGMFQQELSPTSKDITAAIDGRKDVLYYGTTYSTKNIPISFAFEKLTDVQIQKLKELKNDEKLHRLILDEEPYKYYMCKITGTSVLKHISFVDKNNNKYYNGEGSFTFTCYFPYALSRFPYFEDYNYLNIPEWNDENDADILTLEGYKVENIIPKNQIIYEDADNGKFNQMFGNITDKVHTDDEEVFENGKFIESLAEPSLTEKLYVDSPVNMESMLVKNFPSRAKYGLKKLSSDQLEYHLYNCGDEPLLFGIWLDIRNIDYPAQNLTGSFHIHIDAFKDDEVVPLQLRINYLQNNVQAKNDFIYIDFFKQVIQGYNLVNNQKVATNNLYNAHIISSNFFDFEPAAEYKIVLYFYRQDITNSSVYEYNLKTLNPEINLQYVFE